MAQESQAKLSIVYMMEHSPAAYGSECAIPIDANLEESLEKKPKTA
jgi:hypothetical protein